jgi:prepilin-type processing-associated H-X9-DG protein
VPDAVDEKIIRDSPTFPYVPSLKVFRCPSDQSSFVYRGERRPRIRSYSMNGYLGHPGGTVPGNCPPFKSAIRMSDITTPGPSEVFVFLDEHENTINDSHFTAFADLRTFGNQPFLDTPSGRHGNATGFAFADGRAEVRRWVDSNIQMAQKSLSSTPYVRLGTPGARDFVWWTNHTAAFAQ